MQDTQLETILSPFTPSCKCGSAALFSDLELWTGWYVLGLLMLWMEEDMGETPC